MLEVEDVGMSDLEMGAPADANRLLRVPLAGAALEGPEVVPVRVKVDDVVDEGCNLWQEGGCFKGSGVLRATTREVNGRIDTLVLFQQNILFSLAAPRETQRPRLCRSLRTPSPLLKRLQRKKPRRIRYTPAAADQRQTLSCCLQPGLLHMQ